GAIDAKAAVEYVSSPNWKPLAEETVISSDLENVADSDIPDGDWQSGTFSTTEIDEDITVEKVEVQLNAIHQDWGDLKVVLTSPDGKTESVLTEPTPTPASNSNSIYQGIKPKSNWWTFTSVRHWGESSKGEWKLQVFDGKGNQVQGDWNSWKLNIYGTKPIVTMMATDASATEGGDPGQFIVTRTGNTKNPLTVNYTVAGTATNGTDYNNISSSVVIPAGASSVPIPIITAGKDDAVYEGDETVILSLNADAAYNAGTVNSGTVVITDNDSVPVPNVVTNTNDSGPGSLRAAIEFANANLGKDTIRFNIPTTDTGYNPVTGAFTIRPTSALPTITDPVVIDGTTQRGFADKPIIELDGSSAGTNLISVAGISITAGNSIVRGLIINRFNSSGIVLQTKGNNIIEGNFIGTDVTGTQPLGNSSGVSILSGSSNLIGGATTKARNIISGNGFGITMAGTTSNIIQGNYIGTDINITNTDALGNGRGIWIRDDSANNIIGGTARGEGNTIAFNNIGIDLSNADLRSINNAILSNSIFSSGSKGISLEEEYPDRANDIGDTDIGPNNYQNYPVLISAFSNDNSTTIEGMLNSTPETTFRLEFFSNSNPSPVFMFRTLLTPLGYGEGEKFLGFQNVTTDSSGNASFTVELPTSVPISQFISATATDSNNNTSEFSKNIGLKVISPGKTDRVSIASDSAQANNNNYGSLISADGRYITFSSEASNLVAGDTNGARDIFVRDRQTGQTTRISVATNGTQANGDSDYRPTISADGRYVIFGSSASNLVVGDTNGAQDIFVHDRQTGQTTRVNLNVDGTQRENGSHTPSISADGRYVTYNSSVLVTWIENGETNISSVTYLFVYDRQTGQTKQLSTIDGSLNNSSSSMSADGRYIAFTSSADNLVPGDTNGYSDVFVYDQETQKTTRVSVASSSGAQSNSNSAQPSISADGRYVAFTSSATNLVSGGDTNLFKNDIFIHDLVSGQTMRASVASNGTQGNDYSSYPVISSNGRYVAFRSNAANLVDGDTNGVADIFVKDLITGQTRRISVASDGTQANNASDSVSLSADGRYAAFYSLATNLVPGDTNNSIDIFVNERL
ncbi:PD40 domain-containing protein, partial [Planktothrix sp. FACHB-1355]